MPSFNFFKSLRKKGDKIAKPLLDVVSERSASPCDSAVASASTLPTPCTSPFLSQHLANPSADSLATKTKFVVGLDFGTTYSGFAVIPIDPSTPVDEARIHLETSPVSPKSWPGQPPNVHGIKVPTVVTYRKQDLAFHSWGFVAAKQSSSDLVKIERIKLCLERRTPEHLRPRLPPGLTVDRVITDYLMHINRLCVNLLADTYRGGRDVSMDDIVWCLTVPVNWSVEAHRMLRRCAWQAGMITHERSENLTFCFEPEAAAMACVRDRDVNIPPNSNFLVIDCGGGTVDLFQCRLNEHRELEELTVGSGGFFGGTNTDVAFMHFLQNRLTPEGYEAAMSSPRCASGWSNVLSQWENRKRMFTGLEDSVEEIFIPQSIFLEVCRACDDDVPLDIMEGVVVLTVEDMQQFFDPVVDQILMLARHQVQRFLSDSQGQERLDTVFVVGGFGTNMYLRRRIAEDPYIQRHVGAVQTIPNPEVAVLKGAVWAGLQNSFIKARRARKSIGVQVLRPFDKAADSERDVCLRDTGFPQDSHKWLVDTYIEAFISKSSMIYNNDCFTKPNFMIPPDTLEACVNIFASDVELPAVPATQQQYLHVQRDDCAYLGSVVLRIDPEAAKSRPRFSISIYYGRVELEVVVTGEDGQVWRTILGHGQIEIKTVL
ncbi:hypothetical protein RI367_001710 [Sorochytrium milnesiophthora]